MLDELFENQDLKYKDFIYNIVPNISKDTIIGVRAPILRKIAKSNFSYDFMNSLPHVYHEENCIHGYMLERIKEYEQFVCQMNQFLPFINNWAVCDSIKCTCLKNHEEQFLDLIYHWIKSSHVYTIRFGISMLMKYYLTEFFDENQVNWVVYIQSDEYYVNMMRAWYIQALFVKQREVAFAVLSDGRLDCWTHNKAIQKIRESRCVSEKDKRIVKEMRV